MSEAPKNRNGETNITSTLTYKVQLSKYRLLYTFRLF